MVFSILFCDFINPKDIDTVEECAEAAEGKPLDVELLNQGVKHFIKIATVLQETNKMLEYFVTDRCFIEQILVEFNFIGDVDALFDSLQDFA